MYIIHTKKYESLYTIYVRKRDLRRFRVNTLIGLKN